MRIRSKHKGGDWVPSPGHIVRTPVQYADSEGRKTRFPVVVSSHEFNSQHPEVVVAFTTRSANITHSRDYDVEISDKHPNFRDTGLRESTTIRCGRLWTVNTKKIEEVMGIVPDDLMADVERLVLGCFR